MRTLMDKINYFESLPVQDVKSFNEIFTGAKLEGLDQSLDVEIGELADTDTTRFLTVGTLIVKHNFKQEPKQEVSEYEQSKNGKTFKVSGFKRAYTAKPGL